MLSLLSFLGISLRLGDSLVYLEYLDDIVLFKYVDEIQSSERLEKPYKKFKLRFSPFKYKIFSQDWSALTPRIII